MAAGVVAVGALGHMSGTTFYTGWSLMCYSETFTPSLTSPDGIGG
jgi:hypothetical protein